MDLAFEEFVARCRRAGDTERGDAELLALYAYVGGTQRPTVPVDDLDGTIAWQQAIHTADCECGRALPLSERDRARAEATMLGLPFDESAELAPPEMPVKDIDDDQSTTVAVVATLTQMMGGELSEAEADQLRDELILQDIAEATRERERWTSASDRLHGWLRDIIQQASEGHQSLWHFPAVAGGRGERHSSAIRRSR